MVNLSTFGTVWWVKHSCDSRLDRIAHLYALKSSLWRMQWHICNDQQKCEM